MFSTADSHDLYNNTNYSMHLLNALLQKNKQPFCEIYDKRAVTSVFNFTYHSRYSIKVLHPNWSNAPLLLP